MNIVIVGCGRVGAALAGDLDAKGHRVTIVDISTRAFERLPASFGGNAVRGDGTDEDTLRRIGTAGADVFMALTEGDNRNVMAAQLAIEALDVKQVVAKINDPVRADAYADLGIATLCRTDLMTHALLGYIGLPVGPTPRIREAAPHPHPDGVPPVATGVAPADPGPGAADLDSTVVGAGPTREA
jgi:trk system potassium uptake protein TrkA